MMRGCVRWYAVVFLLGPGSVLAAQSKTIQRPEPLPVLVELFTSEGCSSCPPADALLRRLEGMKTEAGQRIVTLSEHVTYWNRLGWADPFSAENLTQRQTDYGSRFHLDEVYTPQMVVNGDREMVGNDGAAVQQALRAQAKPTTLKLDILSIEMPEQDPGAGATPYLRVRYSLSGELPLQGLDVYAVLADDQDTTQVRRGENAGRTLTHVSVVRSLVRSERTKVAKQGMVILPLPEPRGTDYAGGRHVVVFAQFPDLGRVMGVAIRPVPDTFPTPRPAIAAVH
jgi:hypothetical protein